MKRLTSILILASFAISLQAQQPDTLKNDRFTIHAQTTVVNQFKPSFSVKYSGENSLIPQKENKNSLTSSLFAGMRLGKVQAYL